MSRYINKSNLVNFLKGTATPSVSYGAWVAANPGMTRAERTQGLKEFMPARDRAATRSSSTCSHRPPASGSVTPSGTPLAIALSGCLAVAVCLDMNIDGRGSAAYFASYPPPYSLIHYYK